MDESKEADLGMSPTPPPQPGFPLRHLVIGATVGAVIIAAISSGVTALLLSGSDSEAANRKPTTVTSKSATPADAPTEAVAEDTEVYNDSPVLADFALTLKTTEKQCFGSAGCNVTVEPDLSYGNATSLNPEKTYFLTYEIHGDESGPVIQTIELTDQDQLSYSPVSLSTTSRSTKVTAKITDVTVS